MDDKLKDVVITMAKAIAANTLIPDKLRLDLEAALRQLEPQKPKLQTKEYLSDGEIATLISGGLVDSKVVFALAKEVQEWRNAFDELANRGGRGQYPRKYLEGTSLLGNPEFHRRLRRHPLPLEGEVVRTLSSKDKE